MARMTLAYNAERTDVLCAQMSGLIRRQSLQHFQATRQLKDVMMVSSCSVSTLMEYAFRSLHNASHSSKPRTVPLNRVRTTSSHRRPLSISMSVKDVFRSSSSSSNNRWLTGV
jgi:hypothetical protein